jgi:hypothetical protein
MRTSPETSKHRAARKQRHAAAVARVRVGAAGLHEHAAAVVARADLQRERGARDGLTENALEGPSELSPVRTAMPPNTPPRRPCAARLDRPGVAPLPAVCARSQHRARFAV